jgi:hypothetical protein
MIGAVDMANVKSYKNISKINYSNKDSLLSELNKGLNKEGDPLLFFYFKIQKRAAESESERKLQQVNLGPYLAGLFEGDGHIQISKGKKPLHVRSILLAITFNLKDLRFCEHLKSFLENGTRIRIKEKDHACVLIVNNKKGLIKFVRLVNGFMRSPKLFKFNQMIEHMNNKYKLSLPIYTYDLSSLDSNNWLAGFIDADGGFQIRYTDKIGSKFRIGTELRIEQRMIDPISGVSYNELFTLIASFFKSKLKISSHNNINYYMIRASNRVSLEIVLNYLDKYSLFSSKYLDYISWKSTVNLLLHNKAYLCDNKLVILDLKNNMNNKRTKFTWNHLNIFRQ